MDISNLEAFRAQHYQGEATLIWHRLPVARRSAVFVLLFFGRFGELRVVLTKRSSKLRSFPGHISFPGGKADTGLELPWTVARREMHEEIGVPADDVALGTHGWRILHMTQLPCYLSRTFLAVCPVVGLLKMDDALALKLALNPGESSHIFSVPLLDFLYPKKGPLRAPEALERTYHKVRWGGIPWNLRSYVFALKSPAEAPWLLEVRDLSETESEGEEADVAASVPQAKVPPGDLEEWGKLGSRRDENTKEKLYDVWGLTANILHDVARVAYAPESVKDLQIGEEELIWSIWHYGKQMTERKRSPQEAALIRSSSPSDASFGDILPRTEFLRLKRLYKI